MAAAAADEADDSWMIAQEWMVWWDRPSWYVTIVNTRIDSIHRRKREENEENERVEGERREKKRAGTRGEQGEGESRRTTGDRATWRRQVKRRR
ncbi:hypothetical protein PAAG_03071 [Paracoccidioides lutzii Pb01]|uniref:Uncharacterized protein n=1 Tax=Paracoccidioides lutzii (strain ATCC MYA-826 / Pb01) TaxID=502779 RepID=C1GYB7_PARBA|nr:hypothetical protein PAAG_03071 [Paracoccidioides lutzii Pb01]EEH41508.2 hypothetical protein PAAG_03071 [Paracoccidioides lutzii Pb01]